MVRTSLLLAALLSPTAPHAAHALEIRFYPERQVYAYELEPARGLRSVVVQNVAIVNREDAPVSLSQVELEVCADGTAHEVRILREAELERLAAGGAALQASGMLKLVAFQFGGPTLLPNGTVLASTRVLQRGQALLLSQQVLTFSGARDSVRVRVKTDSGTHEASLPIASSASRTAFALPFDGMWHDGAGPSLHSHHRWVVPQEFAHDFWRVGADGSSYRGDGTRFADYYAYGEPALAAAAGQVVAVLDGEAEDTALLQKAGEPLEAYVQRIVARQNEQLVRGTKRIVGNYVLLRHGDEYSLYAHLKPGSLKVKVGDAVAQGQLLAAVGSSGSSTEPHLHFQVCDGPDVLVCAGIPARFENVEIYGALEQRQMQSGDMVRNRPPAKP